MLYAILDIESEVVFLKRVLRSDGLVEFVEKESDDGKLSFERMLGWLWVGE